MTNTLDDNNLAHESFADLLEEHMEQTDLRPGAVVQAIIVDIRPEYVLVDAGLKSEGVIPIIEFRDEEINIGDEVEVVVKKAENGFGETKLSREEARRSKAWRRLEKLYQEGTLVVGKIIERVKGGFTVELDSAVKAFLPGSLVDIKPVRDPGYLEGKEIEFKIIKMDQRRNNVVVSRRAVMEQESSVERSSRLSELEEGQEVKGLVKNITDYGAFVDLGGVDGLLHITDMAWSRVRHPSEMLKVGDEINVKILKFDREKNRVSLGMKQLGDDPWVNIERRYPMNTRVFGKITNIADYGCFVQLEEGVEGLVHMSELDWTNKNVHPSKVVKLGEELEVMVLEVNEERRRISLGIKQCKRNPWQEFAEKHEKGEHVKGKIRSITDFGVFIGLDGEIDGLIHLSDLSWTQAGEEVVRDFKKGDELEAIILAIDPERERISLGVKQMESDALGEFVDAHQEATIEAIVKSVDSKQAMLDLGNNIEGVLHVSDYANARTENLSQELKVGDKIEVKAQSVDRKNNLISVSRKVLEKRVEKKKAKMSTAPTKTTLGDLLKEQIQKSDE